MSVFVHYECFSENLAEKVHNLDADTLKVAYSNTAPNVATHTVLADIVEISAGSGYSAGGGDTQNATSRTGAVTSVTGVDVVTTKTAGASVGPLRYAILYNSTAAGGPLIGYWDRGSSVTLSVDGDTVTTDFGTEMFKIQPA